MTLTFLTLKSCDFKFSCLVAGFTGFPNVRAVASCAETFKTLRRQLHFLGTEQGFLEIDL